MSMIGAINLAIRFLLELAAIGALAVWGFQRVDGVAGYGLMVVVPLVFAIAWGVFRVPGDPGNAPVAVPGLVRLALEFVVFGSASLALVASGQRTLGVAFAIVVVCHYAAGYQRVIWLLRQ